MNYREITNQDIEKIWAAGCSIDLSGCDYGLFHDNKTYLKTSPYYHFLAGVASAAQAKRVIEVGTFRGGSTKAISRGAHRDAKILTFDVKSFGPDFADYPNIETYVGDPLSIEAVSLAKSRFETVDLMFIDGAHVGSITMAQTLVYEHLFQPRWIIWDDVTLNDSMSQFYKTLELVLPGVRNVSVDYPNIRSRECGFAVWQRDSVTT